MNSTRHISREHSPILIAERNPRIAALLEKSFLGRGFPVHTATNGYEAADVLSRQGPALVVLDPDLPYLFALLEAGEGILMVTVPVILHPLSAYEQASAVPAADTVYKDADPEHLLEAVESALSGQATREVQQ